MMLTKAKGVTSQISFPLVETEDINSCGPRGGERSVPSYGAPEEWCSSLLASLLSRHVPGPQPRQCSNCMQCQVLPSCLS